MDWSELQDYKDLIEEETQFHPSKGQRWILTFEELHTFDHNIVFHVYAQEGDLYLLVFETIDLTQLQVEKRLHKINDAQAGTFRIRMSTLKRELPEIIEKEIYARDGSRYTLSFQAKERETFHWQIPEGNFERVKPLLKLIWSLDNWKVSLKQMGWK